MPSDAPAAPSGLPSAPTFPDVGPPLFAAVRAAKPRRVVLQVPAGLVRDAHELAGRIREAVGVPVDVGARPCFGACDAPSVDEAPRADLAIVLGHAPIPNALPPRRTFFVEMRSSAGDPDALAEAVRSGGVPRSLGLVASVQHLDLVGPLTTALAARGYTVRIGQGDRRLAYAAQALGCNYTGAEATRNDVESFLFVGSGRFHPIGLALAVDRPVWSIDPFRGVLDPPIDRAGLVRRRQLAVAAAHGARRWGILVSTFVGQHRMPTALALQERARARGWTAEIVLADRIDVRDLEGRSFDAYVNTACPRIAIDDGPNYPKPILTPPEFLMALGELPLEPYRFDTFH